MAIVKVTLLKPLNGAAIGSTAEYEEADVTRLEALGAVERAGSKKAAPATENKKAPAPTNKGRASK